MHGNDQQEGTAAQPLRTISAAVRLAKPSDLITVHEGVYRERINPLVTTDLLGKAVIPGLPYENPDGSPLEIDTDYFGKKRNMSNPSSGPFEQPGEGDLRIKVW